MYNKETELIYFSAYRKTLKASKKQFGGKETCTCHINYSV